MEKTISSKESKIVAEMLYQLRITAGLRQSDMAKRLGVNQSFVSKVESGERRLDLVELTRILRLLKADIHDFIRELERRTSESRS